MNKNFIAFIIIFVIIGSTLSADPVYAGGGNGYIALPGVEVNEQKTVSLALKYMGFSDNSLTPAFNIALIRKNNIGFELGTSFDLMLDTHKVITPVLASLKLQFTEYAAVGGWFEIPVEEYQNFIFHIYLAWCSRFNIGKLGSGHATLALGYSFQADMEDQINFHSGFYQSLGREKIALVADIANYPYRNNARWLGRHNQNPDRAIVNIGIRILPLKWLHIDITGMDLMDHNRGMHVAASFYL
ncbi:MAG TPA: hypothetical protein VKS21_07915 [Spirochaetota bacterium]|nr:hypothetical protein [Spirochaetota bacterium]